MIKRSIVFKIICAIIIIAFSFENILWANPEIFRGRSFLHNNDTNNLQVQSKLNPITTNPLRFHQGLIELPVKYIIQSVQDIREFNSRLIFKPYKEVRLILNFDGEDKENGKYEEDDNWIVPCSISDTEEKYSWKYEAVITPDKGVSLRKPLTTCLSGRQASAVESGKQQSVPQAAGAAGRSLENDRIGKAVEQIKVNKRLNRHETIKPIIKDFLERFVDPQTEDGKRLLSALGKLRIISKEPFLKKRKRINFAVTMAIFATCVTDGIYPLFAGTSSYWRSILFIVLGAFATFIWICLCIRDHRTQKDGSNLHWAALFEGHKILLTKDWSSDVLIHEFGHFISNYSFRYVWNLSDTTGLLGSVFDDLMFKTNYWLTREDLRFLSLSVGVEDLQSYPGLGEAARKKIRKEIIEELTRREKNFLNLKIRWPWSEREDYATGRFLAFLIRKIYPDDHRHSKDKEAFEFVVSLLREKYREQRGDSKQVRKKQENEISGNRTPDSRKGGTGVASDDSRRMPSFVIGTTGLANREYDNTFGNDIIDNARQIGRLGYRREGASRTLYNNGEKKDENAARLIEKFKGTRGFKRLMGRRQDNQIESFYTVLRITEAMEEIGATIEEFEKTIPITSIAPKSSDDSLQELTWLDIDIVISMQSECGKVEKYLVEVKGGARLASERMASFLTKGKRKLKAWRFYQAIAEKRGYKGTILAIDTPHPDYPLREIAPLVKSREYKERKGFYVFFTEEPRLPKSRFNPKNMAIIKIGDIEYPLQLRARVRTTLRLDDILRRIRHNNTNALDLVKRSLEAFPAQTQIFVDGEDCFLNSLIFPGDIVTITLPDSQCGDSNTPYLRDLREPAQLTQNIHESILSLLLYGKKITLMFNRKLNNFDNQHANLIRQLDRWKRKMKIKHPELADTIDSLIIDDFATQQELREKLTDVEENNLTFTFSPQSEKNTLETVNIGNSIQHIYIKEGDISITHYYPLIEIVTISLVTHLMNYTKEDIYSICKDMPISKEELAEKLNIADINDTTPGAFLIFTLIPNATRYDPEEPLDRHIQSLKFLASL